MKNKKLSIKNIVFSTIKILLGILLIAFVVVVFLQRFSNNRISFFDYRMFTVVSGSMEPKYMIGDVLVSKEVSPSEIKIGDPISYLGNTGSFKDKVITHEVIGIEKDVKGKYLFHTKGLTNLVEDPIVSEEQLFGVVKYKSILLSFIYKIVSTKWGMYVFIILPIAFIIGSEILNTMLEKEEKRRNLIKNN